MSTANGMQKVATQTQTEIKRMISSPSLDELLALSDVEKIKRFDALVRKTFSHVDGRDLLRELHPRRQLDIKRRVDAKETWFEGDWLSDVWTERNGGRDWASTRPDSKPIAEPRPSGDERGPETVS